MLSPPVLTARYRAEGRRITPQRSAVFAALHGNASHPTAESVYATVREQLPDVSLRTIYSVLTELVDMGEIQRIDLGDGPARFDPHNAPHHHLVCTTCGTAFDVSVEHGALAPVASPGTPIDGFEIDDTEIVFRGTCRRCASGRRATAHGPESTDNPPTSTRPTNTQPTTTQPTTTRK